MTAVVVVHGMDELVAALGRLDKDAPKELLAANGRIARTIFIPAAVKLAPVGPHQGGGPVVPIVKSIRATVTPTTITLEAGGPRTPHAKPEEFGGTIPRRGFKRKGRYAKRIAREYGAKTVTRIKAHPFIYPALERSVPAALKVYEEMLQSMFARYDRKP